MAEVTSAVQNAKIVKTMLGIEDHGVFTYTLHLRYGDSGGQGAGGYVLGGVKFGIAYLRKILETVGVMEWEELPGTHIRVKADFTKVYEIGNLLEDKWMDLSLPVEGR